MRALLKLSSSQSVSHVEQFLAGTEKGGGYRSAQRQETNQGHRSSIIISKSNNATGARALYFPLSPRIFYAWFVYSTTAATDRAVHRGPPPRSVRRGGQFSTRTNFLSRRSRDSERGKSWPCIEHKGPPSTNNMHPKDGHDSRGRNYTLRRSPHVRVGLPPNLKLKSGRLPESQTHQSDSLVVVGGDRSAG